jgi:hypothetical protein
MRDAAIKALHVGNDRDARRVLEACLLLKALSLGQTPAAL